MNPGIHDALEDLEAAQEAVFAVLDALKGKDKQQGIRAALNAGIPATKLAKGLQISRSRLYQLKG